MNTGMDTWVPNVANFFTQARQYLRHRSTSGVDHSRQMSMSTSLHSSMPHQNIASVDSLLTTMESGTLASTSMPTGIPHDLTKASSIDIEAALLRRSTSRTHSMLVPEVLNSLELAAYYLRLLVGVGSNDAPVMCYTYHLFCRLQRCDNWTIQIRVLDNGYKSKHVASGQFFVTWLKICPDAIEIHRTLR